jgi:MurNAc alpha-1-phosphate uridylyltransferase
MIQIRTAMALAAGLGTRMRPLTNDRPKALVEVRGKALLDWALDRYAAEGIEQAIVNIHHFPDLMMAHIEAGHPDLALTVSDERDAVLETGGGVVKALPLLGDDPVFITNIDAIWTETGTPELTRMREIWDGTRMDVLLLLTPMTETLGFDGAGDFFLDPGGQVRWRGDAETAPFAYAGVQILNPAIMAGRPATRFSMTDVWRERVSAGRVFGMAMENFWMHVGDPVSRNAAEARLTD